MDDLQARIDELIAAPATQHHPMFLTEIEAQEKVIALQNELAQALITIKALREVPVGRRWMEALALVVERLEVSVPPAGSPDAEEPTGETRYQGAFSWDEAEALIGLLQDGQKHASGDLSYVISFEGFKFSEWYRGEPEILEPRLAALGYSNFHWHTGDGDSFGPLTRSLWAEKDGKNYEFWYG